MKEWMLYALTAVGCIAVSVLIIWGVNVQESSAAERKEQYKLEQMELGKACFEAGGDWDWDAWTGWICEFHQGDK